MTENEAIERLKCMRLFMQIEDAKNESKFLEDDYIANKMAIKALEEIQQCRELGTMEELKALKEKNEPKKVTEFVEFEDDSFYSLTFMCPACNSSVFGQPYKPNNCKHCGANLAWQ